jgi:hypothetical protein
MHNAEWTMQELAHIDENILQSRQGSEQACQALTMLCALAIIFIIMFVKLFLKIVAICLPFP